jgi:signal transduction histidine kinase
LLYGAKIEMEQFADLNKARKAGKAIWKKINMLIDEAIDATRTISFELTPSILEDFGLEITLKELCKKLTNKKLRLNCELEGLESRFERDLEIALFRISQELINNIIKHSQAKEGLIKISNKNGRITVVAQDNGKGFEAAVKTEGQGLRNIKNRVKLLNGQIEIKSEISKGTTITINLFLL